MSQRPDSPCKDAYLMTKRENYKTSFYVYVHKTSAGRIFYVGKGHGRRAWSHKKRSNYWLTTVRKHGLVVEVVEDDLLEWYAFEREVALIHFYGRANLVNMTDGGDGSSGYIPTAETRLKTSRSSLIAHAQPHNKERHRAATKAALADPELRTKMSKAGLGRKQSNEHISNRIASIKASPAWRATRDAMRGETRTRKDASSCRRRPRKNSYLCGHRSGLRKSVGCG